MAAIAMAAFVFMVALPRAAIPLIDGDVWWHIRAGEEILDAGRVATTDTWSIVGAGMPWISQDWLTNVVLALGYRLGEIGPTVLSLLFSFLVVGALLLLWAGIGTRDDRIGWLSRIVWLTVGLTVAGPVVGVRVQVIDLLLAAASILVLWHYLRQPKPVILLWLPMIAVAWANLHAGWLLLFLLGGAIVVGEAVDRMLHRELRDRPLTWRQLGRLGAALVVALGVISLNPNGPALYLYPFETASIAAHRNFLAEWSPPDLGSFPGQIFAGFVLAGVLPALALGVRRLPMADIFVLAGLTVMAASSARFLLVAGPIGAAIVALAIAPAISGSRIGRAMAPTLRRMSATPSSRPTAVVNLSLVAIIVVSGLAVTANRTSPVAQTQAIDEHMPVAAVDWILANDPGQRPFNTYSWGGYLGWRRPDTPVYIDGRSDIYGDQPIRSYADAISLRTDPQVLLDEHGVDHVLFNTDHPFASWLNRSPRWRLDYTDSQASVWIRAEDDR